MADDEAGEEIRGTKGEYLGVDATGDGTIYIYVEVKRSHSATASLTPDAARRLACSMVEAADAAGGP